MWPQSHPRRYRHFYLFKKPQFGNVGILCMNFFLFTLVMLNKYFILFLKKTSVIHFFFSCKSLKFLKFMVNELPFLVQHLSWTIWTNFQLYWNLLWLWSTTSCNMTCRFPGPWSYFIYNALKALTPVQMQQVWKSRMSL